MRGPETRRIAADCVPAIVCYHNSVMNHEFQPEENLTPPSAALSAPQAPLATKMDAETRAAQLAAERLNAITLPVARARRGYEICVGVALCFVALMCFLFPLLLRLNGIYGVFAMLLCLAGELIALGLGFRFRDQVAKRFDAEEITRFCGVYAIPTLIAALRNPLCKKQRPAIHAALTTLLPQLKAGDSDLLPFLERGAVYLWIQGKTGGSRAHRVPDALRLAAIQAVARIGDPGAVRMLKRLAERTPRTAGEARAQQVAAEYLPILQANCKGAKAANTLLRASQAETTAPETLLRPASGAGQTDNAELLRGANAPETPC